MVVDNCFDFIENGTAIQCAAALQTLQGRDTLKIFTKFSNLVESLLKIQLLLEISVKKPLSTPLQSASNLNMLSKF